MYILSFLFFREADAMEQELLASHDIDSFHTPDIHNPGELGDDFNYDEFFNFDDDPFIQSLANV